MKLLHYNESSVSILYLVRHGQASINSEDYDQLSDLGLEQSRVLGEHWADRGRVFDQVYVGPRRRQLQTCGAVAEVYLRHGLPWPEPEPAPELDEHQGQKLVSHYHARLLREAATDGESVPADSLRRYLTAYQRGTRQWARGELETPAGLESWPRFRARVDVGLGRIADGGARGQDVVAFTSGGAIAAAVGCALAVGDEKIIELSWRVKNAAWTELLFSNAGSSASATPPQLALQTFNSTPHLDEPRLVTYI